MPADVDQPAPARPPRTWWPMIGWTLGIVLFGGCCSFAGCRPGPSADAEGRESIPELEKRIRHSLTSFRKECAEVCSQRRDLECWGFALPDAVSERDHHRALVRDVLALIAEHRARAVPPCEPGMGPTRSLRAELVDDEPEVAVWRSLSGFKAGGSRAELEGYRDLLWEVFALIETRYRQLVEESVRLKDLSTTETDDFFQGFREPE